MTAGCAILKIRRQEDPGDEVWGTRLLDFQLNLEPKVRRSAVRDRLWENGIDQIVFRSISGQKLGLPVFIAHALRSKGK